jgi:predicted nucleotidyltransferase
MPRRSSSSAGAVYLDRERRIEALRKAAGRAAARLPALRRVILFGSLVAGIPTPRSDADLLVVLSDSPHAQPRDRVPGVLGALMPLPCPVDLFVLTSEEFDRYSRERHPVVREVREHGRDLLDERSRAPGAGAARVSPRAGSRSSARRDR